MDGGDLFVEALRVTRLRHLDRHVDVDLQSE